MALVWLKMPSAMVSSRGLRNVIDQLTFLGTAIIVGTGAWPFALNDTRQE